MDQVVDNSIEGLVDGYRQKAITRARFVGALAALGASATGVAAIVATAEARTTGTSTRAAALRHAPATQHLQQHDEHLSRQAATTQAGAAEAVAAAPAAAHPAAALSDEHLQRLKALVDDYAEDATVEDPLSSRPIAGKEAIAQRKVEEMASMKGVSLDITHRFVHGDQIVAEWTMRGAHVGAYKGYAPTGRQIELRGVTVVTRRTGKIVKESLFYDLAELDRQLR